MFTLYLANNKKQFLERNKAVINILYNGIKQIYGPYNNSSDGRSRVVLYDGYRRVTRQFSKLKMGVKLNRRLGVNETVDHVDEDFMNDNYSNLELLFRREHIKRDRLRHKLKEVCCEWCGNKFVIYIDQARQKLNKAGPFCSKSCIGKYSTSLRDGKILPKNRNYKAELVNYKSK